MDRFQQEDPEGAEADRLIARGEPHAETQPERMGFEEIDVCRRDYLEARDRYEKLLESAPDALLYVDREGRIVLHNAQVERVFGYGRDELAGRQIEVLIPERFRGGHLAHLREYFGNPHARSMGSGLAIYGLKKDGTEFPADISLSPVESGGNILAIAAVRDITEIRKTEKQIERNYLIQSVISSILKIALEPVPIEEQMDRVLDLILTIPDLALESKGYIYLVEDEPQVLVLKAPKNRPEGNQPCERVAFGKCLCGLAASTCMPVFADCVDERHEIVYRDDFPHGHYCVPIVSGGRALGVVTLFLREGHRRLGDEEIFLTAAADTLAGVIERSLADRERQHLREQLSEAEKYSALGRVTASIADGMRNPLTSVGGFARRLQRKLPEGVPEREYAESIVAEVDRLEKILKNVITLSRGGNLLRTRVGLADVAEAVVKAHEERCRDQSIGVVRSYEEVPVVAADRRLAEEAIGHLLANAVEAMPHGGRLTVGVSAETVRGLRYVALKIADTGEGIPEERQKLVLEPFYTTKIAPKGTGLGLPIVKKIMEDHGGFLRIESARGEGTSAALYFPVTAGEDAAQA
ncbi:MAG: PAS domain S-box protein [Nitrospiraceae bacterium]|nr:PAS domain S-box protein [Nitrospiraceae bacterium]